MMAMPSYRHNIKSDTYVWESALTITAVLLGLLEPVRAFRFEDGGRCPLTTRSATGWRDNIDGHRYTVRWH
jgi:hypothetical protein